MPNHNANYERIKRRYFSYLKEAKRQSETTVDAIAKALNRFESYSNYRDLKKFHYEQAIEFKKNLAEQKKQKTREKLSKATLNATLSHLKRFFQCLSCQPGYKSRIQYCNADYFDFSDKEVGVATAKREQRAPTLEQIKHVFSMMLIHTDIDCRNRALVAFTILTGAMEPKLEP